MSSSSCKEKEIVIEDVSKCTEHPFTLLIEKMECANENGEIFAVTVPSGTVPFNLLLDYANKYNVLIDVKPENDKIKYIIIPKKRSNKF
ncbi:hypothetical protein IOK49_04900 [Fervidicoccus fontis]|uniref:DUF2249 domain-containing protein n=2 Tax=Fervidicoccus fontis TaxID=683846 RepID=I0A230_FERFK|nr:hypothetical protein [Fervidicoccus fontis]AFH43037.1 hypothetical protein FFONT_1049 [Fervidicoccus fontis Kam940]MBE9391409.1 hypothetical protein [Fervidicoccus fontis]